MTVRNIIRHYVVEDEAKKKVAGNPAPRIIKANRVDEKAVKEIQSQDSHKNDLPVINLHKDDHGILTAIDVACSCGQSFTIKLEYE